MEAAVDCRNLFLSLRALHETGCLPGHTCLSSIAGGRRAWEVGVGESEGEGGRGMAQETRVGAG